MRYKKWSLYKIRFYDHAIGTRDTIICETVGWLLENNKLNLVLSHWIVDTKDMDIKEGNVEHVSILKSCIIEVTKLG